MLIKPGSNNLLQRDYVLFTKSNKSDHNHYEVHRDEEEEEGELEIDLDYNEYVEVGIKEEDEPLDLSMKTLSKNCDELPLDLQKPKLPRLELKPNFHIYNFETKKQIYAQFYPANQFLNYFFCNLR